jgi:hypothetical protein
VRKAQQRRLFRDARTPYDRGDDARLLGMPWVEWKNNRLNMLGFKPARRMPARNGSSV